VAIAAVEQPQVRQRQRGFSKPVKQAETPLPDHKLRAVEKKPLDWNKIDVKAPKPTVSKPTPTRSFSSSPGYSRGPTPGASRALDSVTADFFLLPRGLLEDHQIWNCQGSEWTREEGDPFCYSGGKEWRFVSRVLKGRVLALNIAKEETQPYYQEDCHMMKESDLTEEEYARYVSALIEEESKTSIRPAKQKRIKGKMMELQSKFRFRGVELHGQPYIGPVLATELFSDDHLNGVGQDANAYVGLRVRPVGPPTSWFSGLVVCESDAPAVLTEEKRAELLEITKTAEIIQAIKQAPEGELLLQVSKNCTNERDLTMTFVASALRPALSGLQQEAKLQKLKGWENWKAIAPTEMRKTPKERQAEIEEEVNRLIKILFPGKGVRTERLSSASSLFRKLSPPKLVFGRGQKLPADGKGSAVKQAMQKNGAFKMNHLSEKPVHLSALMIGSPKPQETKMAMAVMDAMCKYLKRYKVKAVCDTDPIPAGSTEQTVAQSFAKAKFGPDDAVLLFATKSVQHSAERFYDRAKLQCLKSGASAQAKLHTASQGFDLSKQDLWNAGGKGFDFAVAVTGAAMLAKLGHVPWALDSSTWRSGGSEGTKDIAVVGYDVCHLPNGQHIAAGVRVSSEGDSIMSKISTELQRVQGETVPKAALNKLIPENFARNRIVVIHRDGRFTRDELSALKAYQESLENSAFVLVEIIKHAAGTPRIYKGQMTPEPGTMLTMSDEEVIMASSKDLFAGTANPLNIRLKGTYGDVSGFDMANFAWAQTVFDLSYLHHGSMMRRPRLPVTTHFADRLAAIYGKGGRDLEIQLELTPDGTQQFWL